MGASCVEALVAEFEFDEVDAGWRTADVDAYPSEADTDPYDPAKPEYIAAATPDEIEKTNAVLLGRQIAKLEAYNKRRKSKEPSLEGHYESVLDQWREDGARVMFKSQLKDRRAHSEPNLVQLEALSTGQRCRAT